MKNADTEMHIQKEKYSIHGYSVITLQELIIQKDDVDNYIVGRLKTNNFIVLPEIGVFVINKLIEAMTIDQVMVLLKQERQVDVDVFGFVESLIEQGYVREIDGVVIPGACKKFCVNGYTRQRSEYGHFQRSLG